MRLTTLLAFIGFSCVLTAQARAMDWCALPEIIPSKQSDMEELAPLVEAKTGCERQASDTAHRARWECPDDPETEGINEAVTILFDRQPGTGIHLIVFASGHQNLDFLLQCEGNRLGSRSRLHSSSDFSAGNIAFRQRMKVGFSSKSLIIASMFPEAEVVIVSDTRYGRDSYADWVWHSRFGITTEKHPKTDVKLAGLSPISNSVFSIVDAFKGRGSTVLSENLGALTSQWVLSPPVGLSGVKEVRILGAVRHLYNAKYILESTDDYRRFIDLLDAEYGASRRVNLDEGCALRRWESGRVFIGGKYCPHQSDEITFYNLVAAEQMQEYHEMLAVDGQESEAAPTPSKIDEDMF